MNLSGNQIGGAGAVVIAKGLKKNTNLKSLYLNYNKIGAEGAIALAQALEDSSLENLFFSLTALTELSPLSLKDFFFRINNLSSLRNLTLTGFKKELQNFFIFLKGQSKGLYSENILVTLDGQGIKLKKNINLEFYPYRESKKSPSKLIYFFCEEPENIIKNIFLSLEKNSLIPLVLKRIEATQKVERLSLYLADSEIGPELESEIKEFFSNISCLKEIHLKNSTGSQEYLHLKKIGNKKSPKQPREIRKKILRTIQEI